jgi:hypothetical protein
MSGRACPHCPAQGRKRPCLGLVNRRACQLADPADSEHDPRMVAVLQARADGEPAPQLPAPESVRKRRAESPAATDNPWAERDGRHRPRAPAVDRSRPCIYLGEAVRDAEARPVTRVCRSCEGYVRQKVFACHHPGHAADPTTTHRACEHCPDYEPNRGELVPDYGTLPVPLIAPSQARRGIMRGGIIQIMVTRACDLACFGCSQGSNLAGKPAVMTPDQFDQACASLEGYWGIVGMFGGNPAMHPQFDELCRIMRGRFPLEQRGLWCNNLRGKGAHARSTFCPQHSNINVHLDSAAAEEFRRDWPESAPFIKGEAEDSRHGSPWVAMKDVVPDESERWKLIEKCDINAWWSGIVGVFRSELRAYFCEIAGAQAMLHQDNPDWDGTGQPMPDTGLPVEPGWWKRPMRDYEHQARLHCHNCSVPLRRAGQFAIGGEREEFSPTHAYIARPKVRERPVAFVGVETLARSDRPATEYLPGITPRVNA